MNHPNQSSVQLFRANQRDVWFYSLVLKNHAVNQSFWSELYKSISAAWWWAHIVKDLHEITWRINQSNEYFVKLFWWLGKNFIASHYSPILHWIPTVRIKLLSNYFVDPTIISAYRVFQPHHTVDQSLW